MTTTLLRAFARFVDHHFVAYICICMGVGLCLRLWWAGGDLALFLNPLFPLFTR